MIVTVTTNPMLDKTIYLDDFSTGKIWRSNKVENVAGGKGINVSFQLKHLGIESIATGFLGGETGKHIKRLVDLQGVKNDFTLIKDSTRIGFTVLNEQNLEQTSVFEPGHKVTRIEIQDLISKIIKHVKKSKWLVFSGSVPHSNLKNIFKDIALQVIKNNPGIRIALDSYGEEFVAGLKIKPFIAKQNKNEFEKTFNLQLNSEQEYIDALSRFLGRHSDMALITNGDKFAYYYYDKSCYKVIPPKIKVINPIGSGDCMLAGLIYGFLNNLDIIDTIKYSIAAAAVNASKWEIARCSIREIKSLMKSMDIRIEKI
jgi:1-phosphofructokinase family hexose kinase